MANIISPRRKRQFLDSLHDGTAERQAASRGINSEGAYQESERSFVRRVNGSVTVRMPERPIGFVALDGRVWDGHKWTRPRGKE